MTKKPHTLSNFAKNVGLQIAYDIRNKLEGTIPDPLMIKIDEIVRLSFFIGHKAYADEIDLMDQGLIKAKVHPSLDVQNDNEIELEIVQVPENTEVLEEQINDLESILLRLVETENQDAVKEYLGYDHRKKYIYKKKPA